MVELSEDLMRFLDSCPAYAWVLDLEFRYVYLNDAARRDGYGDAPMSALVGRRGDEFLDPDEWEKLVAVDRLVLATGEGRMVEETIVGRAALSMKWPMRDAAGEVVGVGGFSFDVTNLRGQRLRALADNEWLIRAMQASNMIVEALAAGIAVSDQSDDDAAAPFVD